MLCSAAQCNTLIAAGYETTANALSFALYLLSTHPEAQARVAAEVDAAFGRTEVSASPAGRLPGAVLHPSARRRLRALTSCPRRPALAACAHCAARSQVPCRKDLERCPYVTAVISESLIYPTKNHIKTLLDSLSGIIPLERILSGVQ